MKKYKHFISLGYFCSIASELERIGLRDCSSPFDWIISDWKGIEKAIITKFENFLVYENMYQDKNNYAHYEDKNYGFKFFHDFSKYKSLDSQLYNVKQKYQRRIERFFENIKEPTLFIRYISSENGDEELRYIERNYKIINDMIKGYNENNEICFIANSDIYSEILNVFYVDKDNGDLVARKPFDKNEKLFNYFNSFEFSNKSENLIRYRNKQKSKIFFKVCTKIANYFKKKTIKQYRHFQQY